MVKLDGKFSGVLVKNKDNTIIPVDQWMVFLAKDNAFPATLRFYRQECERQGAGPEQLAGVDECIAKVDAWRAAHPDECKVPDVQQGELFT